MTDEEYAQGLWEMIRGTAWCQGEGMDADVDQAIVQITAFADAARADEREGCALQLDAMAAGMAKESVSWGVVAGLREGARAIRGSPRSAAG